MATTHTLKTWPIFFDAIERGEKTFEVRKNDRQFQRGDTVILQRFHPELGPSYENGEVKQLWFRVGYVLSGPAFGIEAGYCVFGLEHPQYRSEA